VIDIPDQTISRPKNAAINQKVNMDKDEIKKTTVQNNPVEKKTTTETHKPGQAGRDETTTTRHPGIPAQDQKTTTVEKK